MITARERQIFKAATDVWGIKSQMIACIEELNEAAAALARHLNDKTELDKVHEELADAEIMIDQMKCIFYEAKIQNWRQRKLDRLCQIPAISQKLRK